MKWSEALSILSNNGKLKPHEVEALVNLPSIRDEVFFPDYHTYNYVALDTSYYDTKMPDTKISFFEMGLTSIPSNRTLGLGFVFDQKKNIYNGIISNNITLIDRLQESSIIIGMDELIKKRGQTNDISEFYRLENYEGTLEERFKACLTQIKYNYDTYAKDIISGEYWDNEAYDTSYR